MTIAVTGHRDIVIDEKLIREVDYFLTKMAKKYAKTTLLCALADGADQLVARLALKHTNMNLEVPLPMNQEVYEKTLIHKDDFFSLLHEATLTYVIPKDYEHPYENLGHYLISNADVLLALWDGTSNEKQGGTGDVVEYAKPQEMTIVHIFSQRKSQ